MIRNQNPVMGYGLACPAAPRIRCCCRCGKEFEQHRNRTVCPACRVDPRPKGPLSFRECQIAQLVRAAKGNKGIAYETHLAEGTVKVYLNRIFHKLGISNRTELAIFALQNPDRVTFQATETA